VIGRQAATGLSPARGSSGTATGMLVCPGFLGQQWTNIERAEMQTGKTLDMACILATEMAALDSAALDAAQRSSIDLGPRYFSRQQPWETVI